MHYSLKRMWALRGVIAAIAAVAASSAVASHKAGPTIVIWTDSDRAAAVTKVANDWAATSGATIKVVTKNFGDIRDNLSTVAAADAPDVITAAHDWTGQLAANGLVEPIFLSTATKAQFPSYTLNAFSYGTAVKKLYGVPAAVENIGLVVNTKLAKVPTTFKQLETEALAVKKAKRQTFGIAVQQGSGGDAYHMYPFFSGLGGYIFGTNHAGNLDPSDIGVANPTDSVRAQFSNASKGGVPMPNIPQMNSVWSDLGQAWVRSTKGAGAMTAAKSFKAAARSIAAKIG